MKQRLLASVAATALLAAPGLADTAISTATTTALTTGTLLSDGIGTANAGNITIGTGGSITIEESSVAAVTINTSNWLYSNGTLSNTEETSTYGVLVDVSDSPDFSSATVTTERGIYLDSNSAIELLDDDDNDDDSGKYGIYFNGVSSSGTYTGDLVLNGAAITIEGSASNAIYISSNTEFVGDVTLDGAATVTMSQGSSYFFNLAGDFTGNLTLGTGTTITMVDDSNTAIYLESGSTFTGDIDLEGTIVLHPNEDDIRTTSSASLQAIVLQGKIDGNLTIGSDATIDVIGSGSTGLTVSGYGITGAMNIAGSLKTEGYSEDYDDSSDSISTYPEAGTALAIGADIDGGVMITGEVITLGTGTTVSISPSNNSSVSQTSSLTIGIYQADTANPGFSFYNRGTISAKPMNENNSAATFYTVGSSVYPTVFTGGFYNAGAISATASTDEDSSSSVSATTIAIGAYTYLDSATFDYTTGTWSDVSLAGKDSGDQAAFVNSNASDGGTITASVSGYKAGAAIAISISQYAQVPSLINSGTISAVAVTSDKELTTTVSSTGYSEYAVAITDSSGSLTSIYNTGCIAAVAGVSSTTQSCGATTVAKATDLDSDLQLAVAINLSSGNTATPSGSGVTITERAVSSDADIIGDIYFGTGDNQVIDVEGTKTGSTIYYASITGNISYGATGSKAIADTLQIGAYGIVTGKVTAGSGPGVNVSIDSNGALYLLNDTTALNAASVHVADSGILSISASRSLTSDGVIDSKGTVIFEKGSELDVTFTSYLPRNSSTFTLITAPSGDIQIDSDTLATANDVLTTNVSAGGSLPYLFTSAELEVTSDTSGDALTLTVVPKTATDLNLAGYAAQLFPYVNTALSIDNDLGVAMLYGVNSDAEAQAAYSAFAPNVTGVDRAVAISITDSATGPIAARQRSLLKYAHGESGTSVWANSYAQMIKDPGESAGSTSGTRELSGFKDKGFGLSIGVDTGSKKYGWYGAAVTYYKGDANEVNRASKTHEQWILLSGYSVWRGKGLFLNSKVDLGYGKFNGTRSIDLDVIYPSGATETYSRTASNKREGALLSGSLSTGAYFNYGAATIIPTFSLDGLMLRENGFTEYNDGTVTSGDAFDLKIQPYYARSLRAFLGVDLRYNLDIFDFNLQPEMRAGYRYDFFTDPQKLKVAFAYSDVSGAYAKPGEEFTITGPDPAKGSLVLGTSLSATTEDWTVGLHFDLLRGDSGVVQQVGTLSVVGKI